MGKGDLVTTASFRPGKGKVDFDAKVEVGPTPLPDLNDLFRAYGKFDVYAGTLQVYSEIGVHDNYMKGYVKPLFKDIEIYDSRQEAGKSLFKKVYESVVDAAATILTNRKKDQVATNASIEGPIGGAGTNILRGARRVARERVHQGDPAGLRPAGRHPQDRLAGRSPGASG